jgi:hypothetical protein
MLFCVHVAKSSTNLLRFRNIIGFVLTLAVNGLVGTTLLNDRTTVQVSDLYSNPFTPAGYVFAIWGIICSLLLVFVIYQALPKQKDKTLPKPNQRTLQPKHHSTLFGFFSGSTITSQFQSF